MPTEQGALAPLLNQIIAMNQFNLEDQVKTLIKDNYELKMQNAADTEQIQSLESELCHLKQPFKMKSQQEELRDIKCKLYEVINMCQQKLLSDGSALDVDQQQDNEANMSLNRQLFAVEMNSMTDVTRFLNFEISHLNTISDLAAQLRRLISVHDFRSVNDLQNQLQQMLSPQQLD